MAKTILDVMKRQVEQVFVQELFELLSISTGVSKDADERDVPFVRLEVEVPRDLKPFGRCRFSVKVPNGVQKVTQEKIDESEEIFLVSFENLTVSYIDNKGTVYWKADAYDIEKGDE